MRQCRGTAAQYDPPGDYQAGAQEATQRGAGMGGIGEGAQDGAGLPQRLHSVSPTYISLTVKEMQILAKAGFGVAKRIRNKYPACFKYGYNMGMQTLRA